MKNAKRQSRAALVLPFCLALFLPSACTSESATGQRHTTRTGESAATEADRRRAAGASASSAASISADYGPPVRLGSLEEAALTESSGVAASRLDRRLFWTHNDSGDGPYLYAFDREGRRRGVWQVTGARAEDWEDIAAGPGPQPRRSYLYVGDIGDNRERRTSVVVYRIPEPPAADSDAASTKADPRRTEAAEAIRLRYPDGSHDAETLMVHPTTGDLYIVTKTRAVAAVVYKATAPLDASQTTTLTRVGEVRAAPVFGGLITGGDISPDGRRLVLCDYVAGYEFQLPQGVDPNSFDEIWKQTPAQINLGQRRQGEAVCYTSDGQALIATSEQRPSDLFEVRRRAK